MRAYTRALSLLFCVACSTIGCMQVGDQDVDAQDPHEPGDEIGTFAVTGKLKDDSCGAENLSAPTKWSFDLKLSRKGDALYWQNGREAIVGDIDDNGAFSFDTRVEVTLEPPRGATKGCVMVRRDLASGTLKSSETVLSGALTYTYDAKAGTDCTEYALGAEGQPVTLPCSLSYALSGSR
jgi:hypothetical protein